MLLYEELISNYGPTSQRPLQNNSQIMDVGVGLQIQQVIELVNGLTIVLRRFIVCFNPQWIVIFHLFQF